MGISKSRQSRFKTVQSTYVAARGGIRRARKHMDPMEGKEEDRKEGGKAIDPASYLSRKEKKKWVRLSSTKKQRYIQQAERTVKRHNIKRGVAKGDVARHAAEHFVKDKIYRTKGWRRPVNQKNIGPGGAPGEVARAEPGPTMPQKYDAASPAGQPFSGADTFIQVQGRPPGAGAGIPSVSSSGVGTAASGGTGITVLVAKKTAELFTERIRITTAAIQSQKANIQSKLDHVKEQGGSFGTPGGMAAFAMAAMASAVFSVAFLALQVAVTVFLVFLAILIPLVIAFVVVGIIASLFAWIAASIGADPAFGSGEDIVAVAVAEIGYHEEAGNHTKYGAYTGTDGLSWCHAFVSWCANECGFIEMGLIPKTASCEEGRQWFIRNGKYHGAGQSDEPEPGEIIYFDFGHEGVSHHVGIVEYTENGIVHTVEGNKSNQVMRGHYQVTSSSIMGYGQPDYPESGISDYGSASEFLSKVKEIGELFLSDADWKYSNYGNKNNLDAARNAPVHQSNCALAICFAMQEFGTLRKNQTFYSDLNGNLRCTNSTREQLLKYYEIINVGGKRNAVGVNLKPGDICLWNIHVNVYAGEREGKKVWYDFSRNCVADKKANSGAYVKYIREGNIGQTLYKVLRLKNQDSYGSGKAFSIPSGLGNSFTYMGWSMITSPSSRQYKLRIQSGEHYDPLGFGKIGDRYAIACTPTFGKIGDYIDFVLANGKVVHGIMADEKNMSDAGCNKWGHDNGHTVLEFAVKKSAWYGSGRSITGAHPEWSNTRVVKVVNLGKNYFDK